MAQTPLDAAGIADLYRQRIEFFRARTRRLGRRELIFSLVRLAVFVAGVSLCIMLLKGNPAVLAWLAGMTVLFVLLLIVHQRLARASHLVRLSEMFYKAGSARLEHRWIGTGIRGAHYLDDGHPYAADLDLFGKGSLFELLCLAHTRSGQDVLADWLKSPAPAEEARARQAAVGELAPRLELREEMFCTVRDTPREVDTVLLAQWAAAPPVRFAPWERLAAAALSAASLTALGGWIGGAWPAAPFLLMAMVQGAFSLRLRRRVEQVVRFCERTDRGLMGCARFFALIESACFTAPRLRELQSALGAGPRRASLQIRRLDRLVGWLNDGRYNTAFFPLARLLFWSTHFAVAIERWRRLNGPAIAAWLDSAGQMEALVSLAAFAFENPDHVFPEFVAGEPRLEAEGLGHPLIPAGRCVRNDLRFGHGLQLLVITGSNMSGKSTFLRTVGVNVVLAQAGAPVRARRMLLAPSPAYALIRKVDSLQDGISRFYREIMRVREIIDLARHQPSLFFLIDEIFDGTNSKDRQTAAEAIVRELIGRGAVGLVTSHDLALAEMAERFAPRAANAHFEDRIEQDRLQFDYRLREGVVRRGNALLLMRSIGLDV